MPFTARIFRNLETELNKNLSFSFSSAAGTRGPRANERFTVLVWIRNNSSIALKNVRGAISPGPSATFRSARFAVPTLGAHQQVEIGRIEAVLAPDADPRTAMDQFATVNVSGQADLSEFSFRDTSRPLTYVRQSIPLSPPSDSRRRPAGRGNEPEGVRQTGPSWGPSLEHGLLDRS